MRPIARHPLATPEIYDHALLADKKLAIHIKDLLDAGTINDRQAHMAWLLIAFCGKRYAARRRR
jgi:hypothetical protein